MRKRNQCKKKMGANKKDAALKERQTRGNSKKIENNGRTKGRG